MYIFVIGVKTEVGGVGKKENMYIKEKKMKFFFLKTGFVLKNANEKYIQGNKYVNRGERKESFF